MFIYYNKGRFGLYFYSRKLLDFRLIITLKIPNAAVVINRGIQGRQKKLHNCAKIVYVNYKKNALLVCADPHDFPAPVIFVANFK